MNIQTAIPISKKLFDIYVLFTREPFVQYFTRELEFYTNENGGLIGFISLDLTDNDYSICILSRDESKQYRAIETEVSIANIDEARKRLDFLMGSDKLIFHDNQYEFFDVFQKLDNEKQLHPNFKILNESKSFLSAKEVIKEITYHYKDIDGNFIDQIQSLNGFDSRIWELFLFCFFREQFFSFKRNYEAPDYMIEKLGKTIAVEAVIVSRKTPLDKFEPKPETEIERSLENEMPLMYGSALFDKTKKKYWEKTHVKGLPFVIAIADFHDTMSMTWSFNALIDYLYGYKYDYSHDENGELIIRPIKIGNYKKPNGTEIPSGFFFQEGTENVSAVIFSSCATLSKFNRMGKQAGLGTKDCRLMRMGSSYNHDPNADKANFFYYEVNEDSDETWSEGAVVYHNPNALIPLDPNLFDEKVAQCFFYNKMIKSFMPKYFPYNSMTNNVLIKK